MEASDSNVLIVSDDRGIAATLIRVLGDAGIRAAAVRRHRSAAAVLLEEDVAVVVVVHSRGRLAETVLVASKLRARPEPAIGEAVILAVIDTPADAAFGLDDVADAILLRPFEAFDFVSVVSRLAGSEPRRRRRRHPSVSLLRT